MDAVVPFSFSSYLWMEKLTFFYSLLVCTDFYPQSISPILSAEMAIIAGLY
jgi:hypothetical protein